MRVNLNALYLIEERLIHAFGRRAKRANLKRSGSKRYASVWTQWQQSGCDAFVKRVSGVNTLRSAPLLTVRRSRAMVFVEWASLRSDYFTLFPALPVASAGQLLERCRVVRETCCLGRV
jgi:hypothetical protein